MFRYIILAQLEITARALNAWLRLLGEQRQKKWWDPYCIIWDRPPSTGSAAVEAYEMLVGLVEGAASEHAVVPLNEIAVIVDAICPSELGAVAESADWDHLIAMLILTFPEIRWIFGFYIGGQKDGEWSAVGANHDLISLLAHPQRDPLFDPTGLRNWVRSKTNEQLEILKDGLELPMRERLAAAIDEELPYAYLHAYTAYRFGCRADVVTTWDLMKARFGGPAKESDKGMQDSHGYWLLLEDMSLNFPDRERRMHLLHLEERARHCSRLAPEGETSEHRIVVTTGQARRGDTTLATNRSYLQAKSNGKGKVVFKPVSGIFDLWAQAGLFRKQRGSQRRGNVPGFCWPPPRPQPVSSEAVGHSAPGKLMLIAENLIRRAEQLVGNVSTVPKSVQGAVLALDALELTGGRTPTTAIEALTLKHRFEVIAECQFSGVEYHIWMKPRIDEIAQETTAICRWFHTGKRKSATLNAEMHIINQLVSILRGANQFDEEQVCMNRVRHLHNTLWMRQKPWRHLFWPALRYIEALLSSFSLFIVALLVWVFVLSLLFWWSGHPGWEYGLSDAITSFFSVGGPVHIEDGSAGITGWRHVIVTAVAILGGFVHLGVFISHLYSMTMRR